MRAILVHEFGGPEVLRPADLPEPDAGQGQVRVRVHAAGVNPFDVYMRSGGYAIRPPLPYTPGADAAGVIDQVGGGVTKWKVDDRVYLGGTAAGTAWGAYAEYAVCNADQVQVLPDRISFAQGAGLFVPYVTAWRALFGRVGSRPGDTVLIHGASGGVGVAATQFAVAAGCTVIGTAGTEEGRALVRAQGAHLVVSHRDATYRDEILRATDGRGPDVIVEMLANVNLDHDLDLAAQGGRIIVIGNRGRVEIDARKIMSKDLSVHGTTLWGTPAAEIARAHRAIRAGLESGALTPVVGTELPLAEAALAHERVMAAGAHGKIVLLP